MEGGARAEMEENEDRRTLELFPRARDSVRGGAWSIYEAQDTFYVIDGTNSYASAGRRGVADGR